MTKGGAERNLNYILWHLENKYKIILVTNRIAESEYNIPSSVERINIGNYPKKGILGRIKGIFWRQSELKRIYLEEKPDSVLCFLGKNAFRFILAIGKKKNCPIVGAIRQNPVYDFGKGVYRFAANRVLRKLDTLVCQSSSQKEYFCKKIQSKTVIIRNPIGESFNREPFEGIRKPFVVSVGRLDDNKNHALLIKSFVKLNAIHPETRLYIFGEGPAREKLEKLCIDMGLSESVFLPGVVENVADKIIDARVYVMSSISEGMPNALMEAMALGLPVISTDFEGGVARELINNGENGILVPNRDCEAMSEKLIQLWEDEVLCRKIGQKATYIRDMCSMNTICNEWDKAIFPEK